MIRWALCLACLSAPAFAQEVAPCDDYRSSAHALAEPWEASTRVFANGEVRLAIADTIEPAAGAFHLIILSPPYDEVGGRHVCRIAIVGVRQREAGRRLDVGVA